MPLKLMIVFNVYWSKKTLLDDGGFNNNNN